MSESNSNTKTSYDVRTVSWYIDKGQISRDSYQEHLKHLTDSSKKAENMSVQNDPFFGEDQKD